VGYGVLKISDDAIEASYSVPWVADHPANPSAIHRALERIGRDKGALAFRRLVGGTHAATWLVTMEGIEDEAVLREFPAGDVSVAWEARILLELDGLGGLAPRLLAEGTTDSIPWLLLSRLPGTADITSLRTETVAEALGSALARVHRAQGDRFTHFRNVFGMSGGGLDGLSGPAESSVGIHWQSILHEPLVLTHFDFWSGNVVWLDRRLSGIVDWNGGCLGPRGFDVGWCRLDLYLLYGEETADRFLLSYESAFGEILPDLALWDLWAVARSDDAVGTWVPNYFDLGRPDLTAGVLRNRHREWTNNSLDRRNR
jgi:hypothetical protein